MDGVVTSTSDEKRRNGIKRDASATSTITGLSTTTTTACQPRPLATNNGEMVSKGTNQLQQQRDCQQQPRRLLHTIRWADVRQVNSRNKTRNLGLAVYRPYRPHLKVAALWLTSWLDTAHSCVTKCFTASVLRLGELLNTLSIMAGSTASETACMREHRQKAIKVEKTRSETKSI